MTDQADPLRRLAAQMKRADRKARVVAVTSGKGGVGKTSLTVNISVALSKLGVRCGVLDGDLGLANIDIVLGISPEYNLGHVLYGQKTLDEIAVIGPEGIRVYAGGAGVYELANLSQLRLQRFINTIDSLDTELDLLMIDTGAGISRNVMSFVMACDEVVVVTTPELTAMTDAYGMIKAIVLQNPQATIRVVVNMAKSQREAESVLCSLGSVVQRFVTNEVFIELLGFIPPDPSVGRSVYQQLPFVLSYPQSKASASVSRIARTLVDEPLRKPSIGISGLFQRMANMVRRPRGSTYM